MSPTNILEISELAALPRGRALVFAVGTRPTLIEAQPWTATGYAARIRASITGNTQN